jgi:hypothetical protein
MWGLAAVLLVDCFAGDDSRNGDDDRKRTDDEKVEN